MADQASIGDDMHISDVDDLPFHQHTEPFHVPSTSDTHFNDGYYFGFFTDQFHAFLGLRLYPNNNVMDGYAGVVSDGVQRNLRASRALLPDLTSLAVGPLRLEIAEPMRTQRLVLEANPTGVEFDVRFTASAPPIVEAQHRQYRYGRVLNDVRRYTQCARVSGTVRVDGEEQQIEEIYGCRDHSWGIRSSMGPYTPIGGLGESDGGDRRAMRLWLPFELGDQWGFVQMHEDESGRLLDLEGVVASEEQTHEVVGVEHELHYVPGTSHFTGGAITLQLTGGAARRLQLEPTGPSTHPQGFGYRRGWLDEAQPGVYRGASHIEHDRFRVDDPAMIHGPEHVPQQRRLGGMEYICRIADPDGREGFAQLEHAVYRRGWLEHGAASGR